MSVVPRNDESFTMLAKRDGCIVYTTADGNVPVDLEPGKYRLESINPKTGVSTVVNKGIKIKGQYMLPSTAGKVYWFHKI